MLHHSGLDHEIRFRGCFLLRGRLILVVIAHRMSTVHASDRIAVMDAARVVALAPPGELAATSGYFKEALALSTPRRA